MGSVASATRKYSYAGGIQNKSWTHEKRHDAGEEGPLLGRVTQFHTVGSHGALGKNTVA